eukprot:2736483-Amphidinium_carterae.1
MRKVLSRCVDYREDYLLQSFLYVTSLARTISSVVNIAKEKKMAPEQLASEMPTFDIFWHRETQKLEDMCRQQSALPNIFFTIAPAEWTYPLHTSMLHVSSKSDLSTMQSILTLHVHNTISALLDEHLLGKSPRSLSRCGLKKVHNWCMRFEFQDRGTLHVHVILWADLQSHVDPAQHSGQTSSSERSSSPFVTFLEDMFFCRVDVQCGDGHHNLL